jgi:hypothetical protein
MSRAAFAGMVIGVTLALAPPARADTTQDECINGFEQSQRLRLGGKLVEARAQLLVCARPTCPKVTQPDCAKWLDEVDAKIPTLIISAHDPAGQDLAAVTVLLDGKQIADHLDGRPLSADPGPHVLRCEMDGGKRFLEDKIVLNEGEKYRRITMDFAKASWAPGSGPVAPVAPEKQESTHRSVPTATWVLGGVSVLGLVSFAGFGLAGKSAESCVPNCTHSQVDDFRRDYLVADLSLGVAVVAGGLATYFLLTNHPTTTTAAR